MNNYDDNNYTKLLLQDSKINVWKQKLKQYLSNRIEKTMKLYVVSKDWIDQYEEKGNKSQFNNSKLISEFNQKRSNYSFPKIFVLDKDYGQGMNFIVEGQFKNNILLIDMSNYTQMKLFSFFYLDENDTLFQGHLAINQLDKEKDIIKDLFENGPQGLIKKYGEEYIKNQISSNIVNMFLYECMKLKDQTKVIYFKKSIREGKFSSRKDLVNGNKNISKEIPNDKEKNTIKNKNSYSINFNISHYKEQEQEQEQKQRKSNVFKPKRIIHNIRNPSVQINKKILESQRMLDKSFLEKFLPNKDKAIHNKSTPGLIGLLNIGATCYMNATLQSFSNVGRLRTYLLNKDIYRNLENEKDTNKKLSFAFAEVLKNLWVKLEQRFYAPENFKIVISEGNPLFKGIAANDPKDLVIFLLQTMHKELNNPPENKVINNKIPNENNLIEVFNYFFNDYNNENKSIISDEFYGYINSSTTCGLCKYEINNVQIINILFFPLEEIRKFVKSKHNNVYITDCFEYYEKTNIYPSFFCNFCKRESNAYSLTKIIYSPKTLIINLNRGKGLEFNVNIVYEEYLNLRKYIHFENSPYYYELIAVICHLGSNDEGGHFIAYCKNSENCEWYKYNDQFVTKCYFDEVKNAKLPYVLFYSYVQTS